MKNALRGVNVAAVGLIYTAIYRLWQTGYVDEGFEAARVWVSVSPTSHSRPAELLILVFPAKMSPRQKCHISEIRQLRTSIIK